MQRIGWLTARIREVLWDLGVVGIAAGIALGITFVSFIETFVGTIVGLFTADVPGDETAGGLIGLFNDGQLGFRVGDRIIFLEPVLTSVLVFLTILVVVAIVVDRAREAELELEDSEPGEGAAGTM
jgi:large-conductance mechanosensitive channel